MKKGENAAESVRECAADLWRKGATLAWRVPQNSSVTGAFPVSCSCMHMHQSRKLMWRLVDRRLARQSMRSASIWQHRLLYKPSDCTGLHMQSCRGM